MLTGSLNLLVTGGGGGFGGPFKNALLRAVLGQVVGSVFLFRDPGLQKCPFGFSVQNRGRFLFTQIGDFFK